MARKSSSESKKKLKQGISIAVVSIKTTVGEKDEWMNPGCKFVFPVGTEVTVIDNKMYVLDCGYFQLITSLPDRAVE